MKKYIGLLLLVSFTITSCVTIRPSENLLVYYGIHIDYDQISNYIVGVAPDKGTIPKIMEPGFIWYNNNLMLNSSATYRILTYVKNDVEYYEIPGFKGVTYSIIRNKFGYSAVYKDTNGIESEVLIFSYEDSLRKKTLLNNYYYYNMGGYTWPIEKGVKVNVIGEKYTCDVFGSSYFMLGSHTDIGAKDSYVIFYIERRTGIPLIIEFHVYSNNKLDYIYSIVVDCVEDYNEVQFLNN